MTDHQHDSGQAVANGKKGRYSCLATTPASRSGIQPSDPPQARQCARVLEDAAEALADALAQPASVRSTRHACEIVLAVHNCITYLAKGCSCIGNWLEQAQQRDEIYGEKRRLGVSTAMLFRTAFNLADLTSLVSKGVGSLSDLGTIDDHVVLSRSGQPVASGETSEHSCRAATPVSRSGIQLSDQPQARRHARILEDAAEALADALAQSASVRSTRHACEIMLAIHNCITDLAKACRNLKAWFDHAQQRGEIYGEEHPFGVAATVLFWLAFNLEDMTSLVSKGVGSLSALRTTGDHVVLSRSDAP